MGVARRYASLASSADGERRWETIEAEYHRTVALLLRVTGRDHLLDGAPGAAALDRAAQPVRRRAVRAPGPPAGAVPGAARPTTRSAAGCCASSRCRSTAWRPACRTPAEDGPSRPRRAPPRRSPDPGGGTWADIGAGEGASPSPSPTCSAPAPRIVAVDRDAGALRANADAVAAARSRRGALDRSSPTSRPRSRCPPLDGLVAANSLHFVPRDRQVAVIRVAGRAPPARRAVHRRRVRRGPRQSLGPAPVHGDDLARAGAEAGLVDPTPLARVPSRFLGGIYSRGRAAGRARRPAARCRRTRRTLRGHAHEDGSRSIAPGAGRAPGTGQATTGTSIRPSTSADVQASRRRRPCAAAEAGPRPSSRCSPSGRASRRRCGHEPVAGLERERAVGGHDRGPAAGIERAPSIRWRRGCVRAGVGSPVPTQSNSSWYRARSVRVALAPCETMVGWTRSRRSARTHRKPAPLGAHSHLWALPV